MSRTSTPLEAVVSELVREAPIPLVLIDLPTRTIAEASDPLLAILQQPRERVVGHLVVEFSAEPSATGTLLDLVATGDLDGYQARRSLRRGDGEVIALTLWTRVLDADAGRSYLLAQLGSPAANDDVPAITIDAPAVIGIVDADWRAVTVSNDAEALVGFPAADLLGRSIFDGVHRSDHADLLLAVASVLAEQRGAAVRLRVRHRDGRWIRVRLQISLMTGAAGRQYAFAMSPAPVRAVDSGPLEDHLRRIALEVRAAGVGRAFHDDAFDIPPSVVDGLTKRQWEVMTRLLQGARVPSIARELHLSPSTVRNHLAAIFERAGVRSQVELLERFGRRTEGQSV